MKEFAKAKKAINFGFAKKIKKMIIKQNTHKQELLNYHKLISSQLAKLVLLEFKNQKNIIDLKPKTRFQDPEDKANPDGNLNNFFYDDIDENKKKM